MNEKDPYSANPLPPELNDLDPSKESFVDAENVTSLWLYRAANMPSEYFPSEAGSAKEQLMSFLLEQLDPSLGPVNMGVRSIVDGLAADAGRIEEFHRGRGAGEDSISDYVDDSIRNDLKGLLDIFVAGRANKQ